MIFFKPPTTIAAQIALLKKRGLQISDEDEVYQWLKQVSYYRLGGYWFSLQQDTVNHIFKPGSTWEMVTRRYEFDRELRIAVFAAIERVEIAIRTRLIYDLSHRYHPNWYEDDKLIKNYQRFKENLKIIDWDLSKSKEDSIRTHFQKYPSSRPPAWKTLEIISMGLLSKLFSNLKDAADKNNIARSFGIPHYTVLENWLIVITLIRNICAHHGRLWDKVLPSPIVTLRKSQRWINNGLFANDLTKLFVPLCAIKYVLNQAAPDNAFTNRVEELTDLYPELKGDMGFIDKWQNEPVWQ